MRQQVTLYGEDASFETDRIRHHLDDLGVPYQFVPVGGADRDAALGRGERATPTVQLSNGARSRILGAPNETALDVMLRRLGLLRARARSGRGAQSGRKVTLMRASCARG